MAIRISHLGIAVKDLAASEALFKILLGEENVHHEEVDDQKVKIASLKVGDSVIELTQASSGDSPMTAIFRLARGAIGPAKPISRTTENSPEDNCCSTPNPDSINHTRLLYPITLF